MGYEKGSDDYCFFDFMRFIYFMICKFGLFLGCGVFLVCLIVILFFSLIKELFELIFLGKFIIFR